MSAPTNAKTALRITIKGIKGVINFKQERFEDKVTGVEAAVDLVGGETLKRSYVVIRKGGILATTVQPIDESAAKQAGIVGVQVMMRWNAGDRAELANLVEEGVVKPRLGQTLALDQAREAQELSETGRSRGKLILESRLTTEWKHLRRSCGTEPR